VRVEWYSTRTITVILWHAQQVQKGGICNGRYGGL